MITFRISPEEEAWLEGYREQFRNCLDNPNFPERPIRISTLMREVLLAMRSRRLVILSEPVSHIPNDGSDPSNPVLVCLNPKGEVK